jgi:hypothetical protein
MPLLVFSPTAPVTPALVFSPTAALLSILQVMVFSPTATLSMAVIIYLR